MSKKQQNRSSVPSTLIPDSHGTKALGRIENKYFEGCSSITKL